MGLRSLLLWPLRRWRPSGPVVAVIRLEGVIGPRGQRSLSLRRLAPSLERAFKLRNLKGVALAINSPGGSPVQSQLIYRRIRQHAEEQHIPVFAFAEDIAASGGYWLALAADEIYAEEASLVGSIGVITAGFGFVAALDRLGVERRLYTAGESKSLLDPFLPEKSGDVARLGALQGDLHDSFKNLVRARRGARLKADEMVLSGEVFSGGRALTLGLIDGIGELRGVIRQRFGEDIALREIEPSRRRFGLSRLLRPRQGDFGTVIGDLAAWLEERLIWARFGL